MELSTFSSTRAASRIAATAAMLLEQHHLPGIAIGIVTGGELVYSDAFGYADIESRRKFTPDAAQRIGSVSKTMLAVCVMSLVEEGRIGLDDRMVEYLHDIQFHGPADAITVRRLLSHTSGIGEFPGMSYFQDPNLGLWTDSPCEATTAELYPEMTVEVPPGTKWAFSHHAYELLGELVARVDRRPIEQVLVSRVWQPLGMDQTNLFDEPKPSLSTGYHRPIPNDLRELMIRAGMPVEDEEPVDGYNIRGGYRYVLPRASLAIQSNLPDMARYAAVLLARGKGLLAKDTFDRMVSREWQTDPRLPAWGLGFGLRSYFGEQCFEHGGGIVGGWNSYLGIFPAADLALIIHMNMDSHFFEPTIVPRVIQALFDQPDTPLQGYPPSPQILRSAVGTYEIEGPGPLTNFRFLTQLGRIELRADDGVLKLHSRSGPWKDGVSLMRRQKNETDLFVLCAGDPEPPLVALVMNSSNEVIGLRMSQFFNLTKKRDVA